MGLPQEVIENLPGWKRQYGEVFLSQAQDNTIVFRGATLFEVQDYEEIRKKDASIAEEVLLRNAVLYPDKLDLDEFPVRFVTDLSRRVLESSRLSEEKDFNTLLEENRAYAQTYFGLGTAQIAYAFKIDPDEIGNFSLSKFCRYLALSEVATGKVLSPAEQPKSKKRTRGGVTKHPDAKGPAQLVIPPPPDLKSAEPIDFRAQNAAFMSAGLGFEG